MAVFLMTGAVESKELVLKSLVITELYGDSNSLPDEVKQTGRGYSQENWNLFLGKDSEGKGISYDAKEFLKIAYAEIVQRFGNAGVKVMTSEEATKAVSPFVETEQERQDREQLEKKPELAERQKNMEAQMAEMKAMFGKTERQKNRENKNQGFVGRVMAAECKLTDRLTGGIEGGGQVKKRFKEAASKIGVDGYMVAQVGAGIQGTSMQTMKGTEHAGQYASAFINIIIYNGEGKKIFKGVFRSNSSEKGDKTFTADLGKQWINDALASAVYAAVQKTGLKPEPAK